MSLDASRSDSIVWLGDPAGHKLQLTGAKAAHLSQLATDYRVPAGFVLTAEANRRARDCRHLTPLLRDSLASAYTALTSRAGVTEARVAVRSSAIDEDGPLASFAGQHDTYLNVSGIDAVAEAVERCWMSTLSESVLAYRRQHELPLDDIRIAVLVQHLVKADASAVVFSANPVTGNRDEIVITASWGLGESIVDGTVTPDSWVVRKHDLEVSERQLGSKDRMTVSAPSGTREVLVPGVLRRRFSLTGDQVLALADLGKSLEARMGWPVDLECACEDGNLYLLQCRPITVIRSAESSVTGRGEKRQRAFGTNPDYPRSASKT